MNTTNIPMRLRDRQPATVQDLKAQAGRLRKALEGSSALTHAQALEMAARMHGYDTWGELKAQLYAMEPKSDLGDDPVDGAAVSSTLRQKHATEGNIGMLGASPLTESDYIRMSRPNVGDDLVPEIIFGLSEVEFLNRLRWHCGEGSEGLTSADFQPLSQVVRGLIKTGILQQPTQDPLPPGAADRLPLDVMRDWHLGTALQWVYESALEKLDGYDHRIHRPALQRLLELCKWGLPVPSRPITQYEGADDLPGARRGWGGINSNWMMASVNLDWFTRCGHAVIFAATQDDRIDLIRAVNEALDGDRHPLPVIDLHEYADGASETQLYEIAEMQRRVREGNLYPTSRQLPYYLKAHTGRSDLPEMDHHVDQLIYGCRRSAERRMSVRAPLVVSLQWRPHDSHLPFMLPRLREENVLMVSMVSPADYTPSELHQLHALMDNSRLWVLAPGAALPPVDGFERVRNDTRKPLAMLR